MMATQEVRMRLAGPATADEMPFREGDLVRSRLNGLPGLVVGVDWSRGLVHVKWRLAMNKKDQDRGKDQGWIAQANIEHLPGSYRRPPDPAPDVKPRKRRS
jgi:hypothetical protein